MTYDEAYKKLSEEGQLHILKYYNDLTVEEQEDLLDQISLTDFSLLSALTKKRGVSSKKGHIEPLSALELEDIRKNASIFIQAGSEAIRSGKVGAVLLAGGMGTRLGSEDPKGMYNIGLTKEVYIFQRLFENLMDVIHQVSIQGQMQWVHLFIMTSDKNHAKTVRFLKEKSYFGYHPDYIHFFRQEMAPATDYNGKIYMEAPGKIASSPNGNGGWYSSMARAGLVDVITENGIEWLNVFGVDNVLQRICDPCFIGAVMQNKCSSGSKVVRKANPDERVGVMCLEDGKPSIVEYYELNDEMRNAKNEKGDPAYNFGVILNYLFDVKSLNVILAQKLDQKLELHVVEKKINHIDEDGNLVKPDAPNGCKFETLILDMVHLMDGCLPYEVVREYEFAPIKNLTGVDSVDTARELCLKNKIEL